MDQQSESSDSRDARVEKLWKKLDTQEQGYLDLNGLKRGLKKIDHPLKNATDLLRDVLKVVDTNGDGRIEYHEFQHFVEHTEQELYSLFNSIDYDRNGRIERSELQTAFRKAGLAVSTATLNQFFDEVDTNNDGVISFDEWRNFLLFLPAERPGLKAVYTYFSSTVSLTAEGDTQLQDTVQGLGTPPFLKRLFGAIIAMASPPIPHPVPSSESLRYDSISAQASSNTNVPIFEPQDSTLLETRPPQHMIEVLGKEEQDEDDGSNTLYKTVIYCLLTVAPDPGYFIAGGLAGVISRTATAPLDRLKVYLIANTGSATKDSLNAAKNGNAIKAVSSFGRPLIDASKELWRVGGIRNLFAGNGLNVVKVMPESAIKFGSYEAAKRAMAHLEGHNDPQGIAPTSKFIAGGIGGIISQFCVYPVDTLKFRMQSETVENGLRGNALIIATAKKMWAQGGIRSCYRGLTMGLVGMFPYSAIDLGTFEFLKAAITKRNAAIMGCHEDDAAPSSFTTGIIGAVSGATGASVVYPINLLRTRLQMQGTAAHPATYTGIWDVAQKTVKHEGVRGLFKGITPNLLKVVPAVSITYMVYENAKKVLHLK